MCDCTIVSVGKNLVWQSRAIIGHCAALYCFELQCTGIQICIHAAEDHTLWHVKISSGKWPHVEVLHVTAAFALTVVSRYKLNMEDSFHFPGCRCCNFCSRLIHFESYGCWRIWVCPLHSRLFCLKCEMVHPCLLPVTVDSRNLLPSFVHCGKCE